MRIHAVGLLVVALMWMHAPAHSQPVMGTGGLTCDNSCPLSEQDQFHCCSRKPPQPLAPMTIVAQAPTAACTDETTCAPACDLGVQEACTKLRKFRLSTCAGGNAQACFTASSLLWAGVGGPRDPIRSGQLAENGCQGDIAEACINQATRIGIGIGVTADVEKGKQLWAKALALLEKQCKDKGDADRCSMLAQFHRNGMMWPGNVTIVAADQTRADDFARRGCDLGDPLGCLHVGQTLMRFAPPTPAPQSEMFRAAGLAASACAQASVRMICQEALVLAGFANDKKRQALVASRYLVLAGQDCARGDALGCIGAANVYLSGQAGNVDPAAARKFEQKAMTALTATCKKDWERCLAMVPLFSGQPAVDRTRFATALDNLVRVPCRNNVWQACALGVGANLTTLDALGDVLVERCKAKNARACIVLSMQIPNRLGALRDELGKRCDQGNDGEACWARSVEGQFVIPVPNQPFVPPPADVGTWFGKACKNNALGCLMPIPPAVMPAGRIF